MSYPPRPYDFWQTTIQSWIEDGSVPSFVEFTGEDAKKAKKRRKKAQREEQEAEELAKKLGIVPGDDQSLAGYTELLMLGY